MNTSERDKRIDFEEVLAKEYVPCFKKYTRRGIHFFSGWITATKLKRRYKLRLVLPPEYPFGGAPRMFIVSPRVLHMYGGQGTINSLGISHAFHTVSDGPGDQIEISYTGSWDASCTCLMAIIKSIAWISGYEEHVRTERDIKDVLWF